MVSRAMKDSRILPLRGSRTVISGNGRWFAAAAFLALLVASGCGKPPQLGDNAEGLKASDALWTAIGTRNPDLLKSCSENIARLSTAGDLTPEVTELLQNVIRKAEGGDWEAARAELKKFIKGQRRSK